MEWCGWNWPCIWSNVFGSATAAWIQAVVTIAVFVWSIRTTRETFKKDQELSRAAMDHQVKLQREAFEKDRQLSRQALDHQADLQERLLNEDRDKELYREFLMYSKSLVRSEVLVSRMVATADNLIEFVRVGMPGEPDYFSRALEFTLGTAKQDVMDMRMVMLGDLPNPGCVTLLHRGYVLGEDLASLIFDGLSRIPPAIDVRDAALIKKRLEALCKHISEYRVEYSEDQSSIPREFKDPITDVHPAS